MADTNQFRGRGHQRRHSDRETRQLNGDEQQTGARRRYSQNSVEQHGRRDEGGKNGRRGQGNQPPHGPYSNYNVQDGQRNFHGRARQTRFNPRYANDQSYGGAEKLSAAALQEFLEAGIQKIVSSEESRQSFIGQLASQQGLEKVRQLLETEYAKTYSILKPTFGVHCVAFLRILSDEAVLRSLALEQQVRTIYNVVYGFNGERAIPFFARVLECLVDLKPNNNDRPMDEEDWNHALHLTMVVFLNTLRMNQNAPLQDEMQVIGQKLADIAPKDDPMYDETLEGIIRSIASIQSILSSGAEVPTEPRERAPRDQAAQEEEEEEIIDFPGQLSLAGPRHDNDHESITDISILPTMKEILCDNRSEYLPTKLAYKVEDQHHLHGIQRLIDVQFRLLREDTCGMLRDSCRFIAKHLDELLTPGDWKSKRRLLRDGCSTPIRLYLNIDIQRLHAEVKGGLEAVIEFEQPPPVRKFTFAKRQWWWRKSTELKENKSVVALIEKTGEETNVVFLIVSKREIWIDSGHPIPDQKDPEPKIINDLSSDTDRASITLRLVNLESSTDQARLVHLATKYKALENRGGLLMVEFPAVVYKHFEGILRCLKNLKENPGQLPFSKWLAPRIRESEQSPDFTIDEGAPLIPPPAYLRNTTLDLSSCLTKPEDGGSDAVRESFIFSVKEDEAVMTKNLAQMSTLDHGQAKALISAFKHEVALTQGPPGCGKSYVGVKMIGALLANKTRLNLGPILCLCYTDHALDQLLNELLKTGIKNIARIGSRSQLPHIEELSFDHRKKFGPKPHIRGLPHNIKITGQALHGLRDSIKDVCKKLETSSNEMVMKCLRKKFPDKLNDIIEGATNFGLEVKMDLASEALAFWIGSNGPSHDDSSETSVDDLLQLPAWSLTTNQRYTLYQAWHKSVVDTLTQRLQDLMTTFARTKKNLTALHHESDRRILQQVDILGITTIGLVNNSDLVRALPAKVMVCEEAGEVLESHVLTALLPSLEHVILIGDHLQLRPKISNITLSKEYFRRREESGRYNLDESLFERLASAKFNVSRTGGGDGDSAIESLGFPIGQLDIQRRMHPDIANLVRKTLYPELHDHEGTKTHPDVAGIKRRLFWLDHQNFEDPSDPSEPMGLSKTNTWEARMVVSLVRYLTRQGTYKSGEIAVLTPYISQMRLLVEMLEPVVDFDISERDLEDMGAEDEEERGPDNRSHIRKAKVLDKIRIATVDNFQACISNAFLVA
ncbi:hypothetical protein ABW20_dc0108760 [Dactylellina cionopaga]|nr:hypothetical protein ABW20_dc0108760 [Dactylellina cionopaga]